MRASNENLIFTKIVRHLKKKLPIYEKSRISHGATVVDMVIF